MRNLIYYVAATLDGYIAGPEGQIDSFLFEGDFREWLLTEYPETMPVQARGPLGLTDIPNRHFDTAIMGRGAYEPALRMGISSPYPHLKQYVVSSTLTVDDPDVKIVATNPVSLVRELKKQDGMAIWLVGGGKLAAALRDEIDQLVIKRNPIVTGSGIPLFDGPFAPTRFTPATTRNFDIGVSVTTYARQ